MMTLDIDFGKIKTKFGGSSAGHNGIESIDRLYWKRLFKSKDRNR